VQSANLSTWAVIDDVVVLPCIAADDDAFLAIHDCASDRRGEPCAIRAQSLVRLRIAWGELRRRKYQVGLSTFAAAWPR